MLAYLPLRLLDLLDQGFGFDSSRVRQLLFQFSQLLLHLLLSRGSLIFRHLLYELLLLSLQVPNLLVDVHLFLVER